MLAVDDSRLVEEEDHWSLRSSNSYEGQVTLLQNVLDMTDLVASGHLTRALQRCVAADSQDSRHHSVEGRAGHREHRLGEGHQAGQGRQLCLSSCTHIAADPYSPKNQFWPLEPNCTENWVSLFSKNLALVGVAHCAEIQVQELEHWKAHHY